MPSKKENIVLVDGYSLAYRAYYALPRLETQSGHPTGATYGFYAMLWKIIEDLDPYTVLIAFDCPQKTFRHIMREEYKAHRKPTPDDLKPQFQDIKDLVSFLGFEWSEEPGYEADDIIGSLREPASRFAPVSIVSSDLDMMQLVNDQTVLLRPVKGLSTMKCLDRETIVREMGISPEQVIDLIAIAGDPSDNIAGVPGIGEKTAARFLNTYHDWQGILANLDQMTPRLRKAVENAREQVEENRKLAEIKIDLSLNVEFRKWERKDIRWDELIDKLDGLEFRKGKERMLSLRSQLAETGKQSLKPGQKTANQPPKRYLFFSNGQPITFLEDGGIPAQREEKQAGPSFWKPLFAYFPLPDNTDLLREWLHKEPAAFVNGETALFLTHPCLSSEVSRLVWEEQNNRSIVLSRLGRFLSLSQDWLERNPILLDIYRKVEVPLLRHCLGEASRQVYGSGSPFTGMPDLSDLPLFHSRSPRTVLILPEPCLFFQARFGAGDQTDTGDEYAGFIAYPTLYGPRFLAEAGPTNSKKINALREATCWKELERIIGFTLYEAGAVQVFSSTKGVSFTCPQGRTETILDRTSCSLEQLSVLGIPLGLERQDEKRYALTIPGE